MKLCLRPAGSLRPMRLSDTGPASLRTQETEHVYIRIACLYIIVYLDREMTRLTRTAQLFVTQVTHKLLCPRMALQLYSMVCGGAGHTNLDEPWQFPLDRRSGDPPLTFTLSLSLSLSLARSLSLSLFLLHVSL